VFVSRVGGGQLGGWAFRGGDRIKWQAFDTSTGISVSVATKRTTRRPVARSRSNSRTREPEPELQENDRMAMMRPEGAVQGGNLELCVLRVQCLLACYGHIH